MDKVAIDIVLLPSAEITDFAVEFNKGLGNVSINKISLNKKTCVPHISLCMGVIYKKDMNKIMSILKDNIKNYPNNALNIIGLKIDSMKNKDKLYSLDIGPSKTLSKLQKDVMKNIWPFLSYEVNSLMLYNPKEINETTLAWIRGYAKTYDFPEKFHPHITLGFGESKKTMMPRNFIPSELAVFQLGNNCTCRKKLFSMKLK